MKAYIHTMEKDGTCKLTTEVEIKIAPLWWQEQGLSYTASGYGRKVPTEYKIKYSNRWRRVYCCAVSNSGTLYISGGETISIYNN